MAAVSYMLLERTIVARQALKAHVSVVLYAPAIGFAFVHERISHALNVAVALWWFMPDRRIEAALGE